MKKLLALLLCLLLAGCARTYDGPTEARSVLYEAHTHYFDESGEWSSREEYAYDVYGNQAVIQTYQDGVDGPATRSAFTYDERGNVVESRSWDLTGWLKRLVSRSKYTYDDQGRITSATHYDGWSVSSETTYTYDGSGTQTVHTDDGMTITNFYDENGWLVRAEATPWTGGYTLSVEEWTRNETGYPLTVCHYLDGELASRTEYTYDEQGREISRTTWEDGVETLDFRWEYDDEARTVTQFNADGTSFLKAFQEDGQVYCLEHYDADGNVTSFTRYIYTQIQVPAE